MKRTIRTLPVLLVPVLACADEEPSQATSTGTTGGSTSDSSGATTTTAAETGSESSTTAVGTGTTGAPAVCGNGVLEGDEQCDDGNEEPGDDCEPGCVLPPGETVWTLEHDGASEGDDWANDVVVAPDGTILVGGYETTEGERRNTWLWALDAAGNELWTVVHDHGEGLHDEIAGLVTDDDGNIYVAGYIERNIDPADDDIFYAKLDSSGREIWMKTFAGADGRIDQAGRPALDANGDLVVPGFVDTEAQDNEAWIRKVDPDGNEIWTAGYEGTDMGDDAAGTVTADASGDLVVVGMATPASDTDMWISKLDANGASLWSQTVDGDFGDDWATDVAIDARGRIYVTGYLNNAQTNSMELWLARLSAAGDEDWTTTWNSTGFDLDGGNGLALDPSGDVFVAGVRTEDNVLDNILVGRWSTDGAEVWLANRDGGDQLQDTASAVTRLSDGSIIVVGGVTLIGHGSNAWVARYSG